MTIKTAESHSKSTSDSTVVMVHQCLIDRAPQYLAVHCIPLFSQRHLCSAERNLLHIPPHQLSTYACRIFATAGPSTWNNLPNSVDNPNATEVTFRHLLKMFLFSGLWYTEHIMGFSLTMHYIIIHIYFDIDNL